MENEEINRKLDLIIEKEGYEESWYIDIIVFVGFCILIHVITRLFS